jgi:hypothetical protein
MEKGKMRKNGSVLFSISWTKIITDPIFPYFAIFRSWHNAVECFFTPQEIQELLEPAQTLAA